MESTMRVKVTVFYGEKGKPITKESEDYHLPKQEADSESFDEALDFLTEQVLEPYQSEGHDLEDDEEEQAVGVDYLAAWFLPDWFDTKAEAKDFAKELIKAAESALADLE